MNIRKCLIVCYSDIPYDSPEIIDSQSKTTRSSSCLHLDQDGTFSEYLKPPREIPYSSQPFGSSRLIDYKQKDHKTLSDLAKENPSQLGDPVSLKAETSSTEPTDKDRPNKDARKAEGATNNPELGDGGVGSKTPTQKSGGGGGSGSGSGKGGDSSKKSLKEIAQDKLKTNPSQLGDPVSLKAETSDSHPTEQDRGALGVDPKTGKTGKSKL